MITANEKKAILLSFFLAAASGFLIYIFDNFFQLDFEWGRTSHPALNYMKGLHYLATPLVLVSFGFIIKDHIKRKVRHFKKESRRVTGVIILIGLILLCVSGQALLFITNEDLLKINQYVHRVTGLITLFSLIFHLKSRNVDQP